MRNSFDLPMPEETAYARLSREKRQSAARSRQYRQKLREEGKPSSREVDEALAEALAFVIRYAVPVGNDAYVNVRDIHKAARLILKREGKRHDHATFAVAERLSPRYEHTNRGWMPSTKTVSAEHMRPPKFSGKWSDRDLADLVKIIRQCAG